MAEDARFRVQYERGTVLADPSGALVNVAALRDLPSGGVAAAAAVAAQPRDAMPPALRERLTAQLLGSDLRFKLYVLLEKLGFTHWKDLTASERARLMAAEHYVALRDGVMWREVAAELEDEGVRPISPDIERCQAAVVAAEETAEALQRSQRELLQRHDGVHLGTEAELARSLHALTDSRRSLRETLALRSSTVRPHLWIGHLCSVP
jgi:hypothetical protein